MRELLQDLLSYFPVPNTSSLNVVPKVRVCFPVALLVRLFS